MARGRTIYSEISTSRRFNRLVEYPIGELAQLIYILSYPHSDDWGHLPFDPEYIKYRILPCSKRPLADISAAIMAIVDVGLWDTPYHVNGEMYVHIFQFEQKCSDGIRKRSKGQYPDESGTIPTRARVDGKPVSIEDDLAISAQIRQSSDTFPEISGKFRNPPENSDMSRVGLSRVEVSRVEVRKDIKKTQSPPPGGLNNSPDLFKTPITIKHQTLSPGFLNMLLKSLETKYTVGLYLYRAKEAQSIKAYIVGGIESHGYMHNACPDEDNNPTIVKAWIDQHIFAIPPTNNPRASPGIESLSVLVHKSLTN
jgi:hypothetical protein